MFCIHCGATLKPNANFCHICTKVVTNSNKINVNPAVNSDGKAVVLNQSSNIDTRKILFFIAAGLALMMLISCFFPWYSFKRHVNFYGFSTLFGIVTGLFSILCVVFSLFKKRVVLVFGSINIVLGVISYFKNFVLFITSHKINSAMKDMGHNDNNFIRNINMDVENFSKNYTYGITVFVICACIFLAVSIFASLKSKQKK